MKFKLIALAAASSALLFSGCAQMQLGGGKNPPGSTAVAGQTTETGLNHCDRPLGTLSIVEDQTSPWYLMLTGQYQLPSTVPVLKVLVQKSGCFVVVDRGRALGAAMNERALAETGEMRKGSKMHKGQLVAADYELSPSITFSAANTAGGLSSLASFIPVVGGAVALVAGTATTKEASTTLVLTDVRSGVQIAAATGSARNIDFGMIGSVLTSNTGGMIGGYSNTPEGKVILSAFSDSLNNLAESVKQYRAQDVKGGLGTGGNLKVN